MDVEIKGEDFLDGVSLAVFNKLLSEYSEKISRKVKKDGVLKIHLKEYKKNGKAQKYSLNMKFVFPGKTFEANAFDWDLTRALHKVSNKMITEIEHRLHLSDQHNKVRCPQN